MRLVRGGPNSWSKIVWIWRSKIVWIWRSRLLKGACACLAGDLCSRKFVKNRSIASSTRFVAQIQIVLEQSSSVSSRLSRRVPESHGRSSALRAGSLLFQIPRGIQRLAFHSVMPENCWEGTLCLIGVSCGWPEEIHFMCYLGAIDYHGFHGEQITHQFRKLRFTMATWSCKHLHERTFLLKSHVSKNWIERYRPVRASCLNKRPKLRASSSWADGRFSRMRPRNATHTAERRA